MIQIVELTNRQLMEGVAPSELQGPALETSFDAPDLISLFCSLVERFPDKTNSADLLNLWETNSIPIARAAICIENNKFCESEKSLQLVHHVLHICCCLTNSQSIMRRIAICIENNTFEPLNNNQPPSSLVSDVATQVFFVLYRNSSIGDTITLLGTCLEILSNCARLDDSLLRNALVCAVLFLDMNEFHPIVNNTNAVIRVSFSTSCKNTLETTIGETTGDTTGDAAEFELTEMNSILDAVYLVVGLGLKRKNT